MCNNSATKFADFVAYQVTKNTIGRSKPRKWKPDPDLPADATLEPDDYRGAHAALSTDRGHQVPLASFSGTRDYRMLNYLSNVTPQRGALNQRAWKYLEEAERRLAQEDGTSGVYVITGPLYERDMPQLPNADEPHRVPSGYFKVVALRSGEGAVVEAFVFDQDTPSTANYCEHLVLVDEVERRAGFDFFVGVPDAEEERLEGEPGQLGVRLGCK